MAIRYQFCGNNQTEVQNDIRGTRNFVELIKDLKEPNKEQTLVEQVKHACNEEDVRYDIAAETQHLSCDMPKRHVN